ncbi:MAG: ParB/RepB/Spo0J family partition protein [Calditrichaeota bacterium]|nr:ParB/RepB/Spo0J family partition protein [Calditrichota bacterium]MCB9391615.1 ParB/RepB/Spo0J family partition protein [Calditrichota bacterium]
MKSHKALGKGLRALITEEEVVASTSSASDVSHISVELIDPNPFQPRRIFNDEAIAELRDSILKQGLLQPVVVRPAGSRYELILGERRLRATKAAGLPSIPAQIRLVQSSEEMLELAILENVHREDLTPIELAQAIVSLQQQYSLTQELIAEKMGMSRAHIANLVRLLKLPSKIQQALNEGKLTMGHARALLSVVDEGEQLDLFERFLVDGKVTVRTAEALTRRKKAAKSKPQSPQAIADSREAKAIAHVENVLSRQLATRVKIKPKGRGGTIEITYYTVDDLNRLLEIVDR